MMDWRPYLESIRDEYGQWWQYYTISDVVGEQADPKKIKAKPPLLMGLMVETAVRDEEATDPDDEKQPKMERLGVLEGLRKYAAEHLLLVGRPGSGKSTALVRLLLEEAQNCLETVEKLERPPTEKTAIPVLVELRYFQTSVLALIRNFLKRHGVLLSESEIEKLLVEGRFLLLVDGVNELPTEEARRLTKVFRQDHPKTGMIFTTRDISVGGKFGH